MIDTGLLLLVIHLLGASIWVGGHLVLAFTILPQALRRQDVPAIRAFESAFERIGLPALVAQVVTGVWLAFRLLPEPAMWLDLSNPMARAVLAKVICLAATAALGLHARLVLIPRLTAAGLPALAWHIRAVTLFAVIFLIIGATLRFGGI